MERPWPPGGCCAKNKQNKQYIPSWYNLSGNKGHTDLFMEFRFNFLTSLVTINYPHAVVTQLCRRIGNICFYYINCRFKCSLSLRRRSASARLLKFWVRIPPEAWMSVCCEWCVLSERGLCDELITHPDEYYRLCCIIICDIETSWMSWPWPTRGLLHRKQNDYINWTSSCTTDLLYHVFIA